MTDRVEPNVGGVANAKIAAGAISYSGGPRSAGWTVPHGTNYFAAEAGLAGTPLNGFSRSVSALSLTANINAGEGFVGGYWFGRDTQTGVDLASNTANQTVYAGVDTDVTNGVIIGLDAAFGADDPQVALWDFTTDASGVTSSVDRRTQEPPSAGSGGSRWTTVATVSDTTQTADLDLDTGTFTPTFDSYRVHVRLEDEANSAVGNKLYAKMQVNGNTNTAYHYDYFDAFDNVYRSSGSDNKWNYICAGNGDGTHAESVIRLFQPTSFHTGTPDDMDDTVKIGMDSHVIEHNANHLLNGHLRSGLTGSPINRIRLWTNGRATGGMVVEGSNYLAP